MPVNTPPVLNAAAFPTLGSVLKTTASNFPSGPVDVSHQLPDLLDDLVSKQTRGE